MGLAFFAAINGTAYVLSLFLQQGLGYNPGRTSVALLPLTVGLIAAAGACMALITKLGRTLLFIGLLITLAGVGWMLAVVTASGTATGEWAIVGPVFVIGMGMGTCFGILFDIALGDVDPDEAGSASGALSAVQQLAAGIGSAAVTSVYFAGLASGGVQHAMTPQPVGRHRDRRAVHGDRPPPAEEGGGRRATLTHLPATAPLRRTIPDGRRSSGPWLQGCTPACRTGYGHAWRLESDSCDEVLTVPFADPLPGSSGHDITASREYWRVTVPANSQTG